MPIPNTTECRYPEVFDPNVTNSLAIYSDDDNKKYRYLLERIWNPDPNLPMLMFVMSHASKATARSNDGDQTVQICEDRARNHHLTNDQRLGFNGQEFRGVYITNIFSFIQTAENPLAEEANPVGTKNFEVIEKYASKPNTTIVCAWGDDLTHCLFSDKRDEMKTMLDETGAILNYFSPLLTSEQPRHARRVCLDRDFEVMP